jgi:RNA polymerase sigma-70 factor (ECF subfamily)
MLVYSQHTGLSDEALIRAYQGDGDSKWLGYLLPRYTALLLGVALKYLKDQTLAEDAVQQVFLRVITNFPQEKILNFKGWLYVLMRNQCLQQLRDEPYHSGEAAMADVPDTGTSKEDIALREYTLQQVNEALTMLNEEQRKSIELFYLKKCSYEQITEQTGYTFMQVKSYIQNGKRNLKTILEKRIHNTR